jgi:hypothetical protein
MTTIINANSTGILETADTSGILQLQTGGTAALTIGTDQNVTANSTGAITLPIGTTAQRPTSPANGYMRYNSSASLVEAYLNGNWTAVTGSYSYSGSYLIVAGGGGAGDSGGGGGGGILTSTYTFSSGTTYTVVVGAGGAAGASKANGTNSTALGLTAIGGGYGGGYNTGGNSGGSGGGGGIIPIPPGSGTLAGGSGTVGQGNAGGTSTSNGSSYNGSGGGGYSGNGTGGYNNAGAGANGLSSSILGTAYYFGGGGGGGCQLTNPAANGGLGGGGGGSQAFGGTGGTGGGSALNSGANGGTSPNPGGDAGQYTGGGGGGGAGSNTYGGAGGSGIVIFSVPSANYSGTTTGSPVITTSGSNTIIRFNSSGSYTA